MGSRVWKAGTGPRLPSLGTELTWRAGRSCWTIWIVYFADSGLSSSKQCGLLLGPWLDPTVTLTAPSPSTGIQLTSKSCWLTSLLSSTWPKPPPALLAQRQEPPTRPAAFSLLCRQSPFTFRQEDSSFHNADLAKGHPCYSVLWLSPPSPSPFARPTSSSTRTCESKDATQFQSTRLGRQDPGCICAPTLFTPSVPHPVQGTVC